MNWHDVFATAAEAVFVACVPIAVGLGFQWLKAHTKSQALLRWEAGAKSFADNAYIKIVSAREADKTKPLGQLICEVLPEAVSAFWNEYRETAETLNATPDNANTKVTGKLADKLALDPTVSVATQAAPPGQAANLQTGVLS